jgi:hypothetical protein
MGGRARYVGIRNNTFSNNYINPQIGNFTGGTLELEVCSDQAQITNNTMIGPTISPSAGFTTSGLELYARNVYVNGNTIGDYPGDAIATLSTLNATVTGNHLFNNDNLLQVGDINAATRAGGS